MLGARDGGAGVRPTPPGPRASGAWLPTPEVPPTPVSFGSSGQRMSGSGLPPARCSARCLGNSQLLRTCPIHCCLATHTPRIWLRTLPWGDVCCLLSGVTQEAEQEGAPGTDGGGADKGSSRHDVCGGACIHTHTPVRPQAHTKLCICVCVYTYYVLGLVAQAHPVSLLLRKAVHGARSGACRGGGRGVGRARWPQPQGTGPLGLCFPGHACLCSRERVGAPGWDQALLATPLTLFS